VTNLDFFPPLAWKESAFLFLMPSLRRPGPAQNLVDCAIYPQMQNLLIKADFDGNVLNKNTGRIRCVFYEGLCNSNLFHQTPD
jgi:hypothetical protein